MTAKNVQTFRAMKQQGERIAVLTAYDASFAALMERAGIDAILVGDSLGVVVQGKPNTLAVTMEEMLYHTKLVASAARGPGRNRGVGLGPRPLQRAAEPSSWWRHWRPASRPWTG